MFYTAVIALCACLWRAWSHLLKSGDLVVWRSLTSFRLWWRSGYARLPSHYGVKCARPCTQSAPDCLFHSPFETNRDAVAALKFLSDQPESLCQYWMLWAWNPLLHSFLWRNTSDEDLCHIEIVKRWIKILIERFLSRGVLKRHLLHYTGSVAS